MLENRVWGRPLQYMHQNMSSHGARFLLFCMPIIICLLLSLLYAIALGITSILSIPFIPYNIAIFGLAYAWVGLMEINIFSMIVSYIINRIINHYIVKQLGGTTGDTYGFVVEVTEVLLILVYIITLTLLFFCCESSYSLII